MKCQPAPGYSFPKHLLKNRLPERVQLFQCTGAEAAQRVRLIQYPRNPLLLGKRWEGNFYPLNITFYDLRLRGSSNYIIKSARLKGAIEILKAYPVSFKLIKRHRIAVSV